MTDLSSPVLPTTRASVAASGPDHAPTGVRLASAVLALVCLVAGLAIAAAYPLGATLAMTAFLAWTALAAWRSSLAIPALFAALPVCGLATWSGWLIFEEVDLLVLATAAGGFAAAALGRTSAASPRRDGPRLSVLAIALLIVYLAATAASIQRGVAAGGGWRFDWLQGYNDPLNSLRVGKSFVWALLLAPLVVRLLRQPKGFELLGAGMTIGLGLCSLAVIRERAWFVGLVDFSEDYRATGPFWENHVGGVALEGYLALMVPFAVRDLIRPASDRAGRVRAVVAGVVLAMAIYACIVTFTRGLYAAIPLSLGLMTVLTIRQRLHHERRLLWPRLGRGIAFVAICGVAGFEVFQHGGYRTLLATFLVAASWMPVEAALRRANLTTFVAALAVAGLVGGAGHVASAVLPKLSYVVFGGVFVALAAALVRDARRPSAASTTGVVAAWCSLAVCAVLVAVHWGGARAGSEAVAAVGAIVGAAFVASRFGTPLWSSRSHEQAITAAIAACAMGFIAVFLGGAYMAGRMSESSSGLAERVAHWRAGVGRLDGAADWSIGKGFGRFPALSVLDPVDTPAPGTYRFERNGGEHAVQLTSPHLPYLNFEALFRFAQRVTVQPGTRYLMVASARSTQPVTINFELCERHLLYALACSASQPRFTPDGSAWLEIRVPLITTGFGGAAWYGARPVFFSVALAEPGTNVEIRSLHLIGPDGVDLLANGDFANGTAHWFPLSERYHLPFHIENMALDVLTDQGLVGLALFTMLVGGALLRVIVGKAMRHPDAPCVAAVIVGALGVGLFDSLVDVPRITLIFYLAVIIGLALRSPRAARGRPMVAAPSPPLPQPSPAPPRDGAADDRADRARRRQRAFGERRPGGSG